MDIHSVRQFAVIKLMKKLLLTFLFCMIGIYGNAEEINGKGLWCAGKGFYGQGFWFLSNNYEFYSPDIADLDKDGNSNEFVIPFELNQLHYETNEKYIYLYLTKPYDGTIYLRLNRYELTLQRQGCDEGLSSLYDDKVQCELFESRTKFMGNLKEIELKGLKEKEAELKKRKI